MASKGSLDVQRMLYVFFGRLRGQNLTTTGGGIQGISVVLGQDVRFTIDLWST